MKAIYALGVLKVLAAKDNILHTFKVGAVKNKHTCSLEQMHVLYIDERKTKINL